MDVSELRTRAAAEVRELGPEPLKGPTAACMPTIRRERNACH
jgi:hypothetical protein